MSALFSCIPFLLSCALSSTINYNSNGGNYLKYDLETPSSILKMPKELDEISGLCYSPATAQLIAIQDEDGIIFFINTETGEVEQKVPFWKEGDYEGVEVVGEKIYVIKSTGTIYEVVDPGTDQQMVNKYNFFLNKENDVEGLGWDESANRLLLACKAEKEGQLKKSVFSFELDGLTLREKAAYEISQEQVESFLEGHPELRKAEKLQEHFEESDKHFKFAPSAIAIHPITKEIYISSSVGKMLFVLSPDGDLLHIEKLRKKMHQQPEGLCFDVQGNLYIANEGKDGPALIYRFDYQ